MTASKGDAGRILLCWFLIPQKECVWKEATRDRRGNRQLVKLALEWKGSEVASLEGVVRGI